MKIGRWTTRDVPLLCQAFLTVAAIRMLLWITSLRRVQEWIDSTRLATPARPIDPQLIGRAVTAAGHRIPAATCLPRALATRYLLRRRGIDSDLQLGVARSAAGTFEAHAWLTCGGETVVGELSDRAYAPLLKAS